MSNVKEALSTWDAADELLAEKIEKLEARIEALETAATATTSETK